MERKYFFDFFYMAWVNSFHFFCNTFALETVVYTQLYRDLIDDVRSAEKVKIRNRNEQRGQHV